MHSITSRFRGDSKSGVHLDKVVDLLEDHEVKRVLARIHSVQNEHRPCIIFVTTVCFFPELIEGVWTSETIGSQNRLSTVLT